MIPDFTKVALTGGGPAPAGADAWASAVQEQTGKSPADLVWDTPEGIAVKPLYTADDLDGLGFLSTYPGAPPFLRGPYPTMYVTQP
ncbi:methylmalonyl-CoA mutase family protein, partial [Sphaerisporangium krabiense]